MNRTEVIEHILQKHGKNAIYIFSTGYISRTAYKLCKRDYTAFYMQGSMGLAPSIGLGTALFTNKDVVVVNGDGAFLMSLGTTHTIRDLKLKNFYHYVLCNDCYESTGQQICSKLENEYLGVSKIFLTKIEKADERVGISLKNNIKLFRKLI